MQVAHRAHVINMLPARACAPWIEQENLIISMPEIEAVATDTLVGTGTGRAEVVPTARAAKLTMNREGIRRLAAEELQLPTSRYRFADSEEGFRAAVTEIGLPCIVKPVMSSSPAKARALSASADQLSEAWRYAQQGGPRWRRTGDQSRGGELRFRNHPAHRQRCRWRAFRCARLVIRQERRLPRSPGSRSR